MTNIDSSIFTNQPIKHQSIFNHKAPKNTPKSEIQRSLLEKIESVDSMFVNSSSIISGAANKNTTSSNTMSKLTKQSTSSISEMEENDYINSDPDQIRSYDKYLFCSNQNSKHDTQDKSLTKKDPKQLLKKNAPIANRIAKFRKTENNNSFLKKKIFSYKNSHITERTENSEDEDSILLTNPIEFLRKNSRNASSKKSSRYSTPNRMNKIKNNGRITNNLNQESPYKTRAMVDVNCFDDNSSNRKKTEITNIYNKSAFALMKNQHKSAKVLQTQSGYTKMNSDHTPYYAKHKGGSNKKIRIDIKSDKQAHAEIVNMMKNNDFEDDGLIRNVDLDQLGLESNNSIKHSHEEKYSTKDMQLVSSDQRNEINSKTNLENISLQVKKKKYKIALSSKRSITLNQNCISTFVSPEVLQLYNRSSSRQCLDSRIYPQSCKDVSLTELNQVSAKTETKLDNQISIKIPHNKATMALHHEMNLSRRNLSRQSLNDIRDRVNSANGFRQPQKIKDKIDIIQPSIKKIEKSLQRFSDHTITVKNPKLSETFTSDCENNDEPNHLIFHKSNSLASERVNSADKIKNDNQIKINYIQSLNSKIKQNICPLKLLPHNEADIIYDENDEVIPYSTLVKEMLTMQDHLANMQESYVSLKEKFKKVNEKLEAANQQSTNEIISQQNIINSSQKIFSFGSPTKLKPRIFLNNVIKSFKNIASCGNNNHLQPFAISSQTNSDYKCSSVLDLGKQINENTFNIDNGYNKKSDGENNYESMGVVPCFRQIKNIQYFKSHTNDFDNKGKYSQSSSLINIPEKFVDPNTKESIKIKNPEIQQKQDNKILKTKSMQKEGTSNKDILPRSSNYFNNKVTSEKMLTIARNFQSKANLMDLVESEILMKKFNERKKSVVFNSPNIISGRTLDPNGQTLRKSLTLNNANNNEFSEIQKNKKKIGRRNSALETPQNRKYSKTSQNDSIGNDKKVSNQEEVKKEFEDKLEVINSDSDGNLSPSKNSDSETPKEINSYSSSAKIKLNRLGSFKSSKLSTFTNDLQLKLTNSQNASIKKSDGDDQDNIFNQNSSISKIRNDIEDSSDFISNSKEIDMSSGRKKYQQKKASTFKLWNNNNVEQNLMNMSVLSDMSDAIQYKESLF